MELKELFGTRFTVDFGEGSATISNVDEVINALSDEIGSIHSARDLIMGYVKLPWEIQRATIQKCSGCGAYHESLDRPEESIVSGTFPKRLKAVAYKICGYKLDDAAVARIGEIAKRGMSKHKVAFMDVTDDLNWRQGAFGDNGSCYWNGRQRARRMIVMGGGGAVRQFTDDAYTRGASRCWILPHPNKIGLVIFNAYGQMNLSQFAGALSTTWGMGINPLANTTNLGSAYNILYFNNPGYYLRPEGTDPEDEAHFRIPEEDSVMCDGCGQYTPQHSARRHEGQTYCPSCMTKIFVTCKRCKKLLRREDAVVSNDTDRVYCSDCATIYCLHTCHLCGSVRGETRKGEPNMIHVNGYWYCVSHSPKEE